MRRRHMLFTLFVLAFALPLTGQDKAAQEEIKSIAKRMMNFHAEHSAEIFGELSAGIEKHHQAILDAGKKNRFDVLVATFLARAQQKYDYEIKGDGVVFDNARAIIQKDPDNKIALFVNDDDDVTPSKLDVWWVGFFTTGDSKYLKSVLQQTGNPADTPKADRTAKAIMGAANWSFTSNCKRIDTVREFATEAVEQEEWAAKKKFLQSCLKK